MCLIGMDVSVCGFVVIVDGKFVGSVVLFVNVLLCLVYVVGFGILVYFVF